MVDTELVNRVSAFGRLLEYSANKRYGFKNKPLENDSIDKIALSLNQKIKETKGLDILGIENKDDIFEYEATVNDLLSEYTYSHIINPDIEQRQKLKDNAFKLHINDLKKFDIKINSRLPKLLRKYNLNEQDLITYCKNGDTVYANDYNEAAEPVELYVNKKINFRGEDKLLFLFISRSLPSNSDFKHNLGNLELGIVGIFPLDKFQALVTLPVEVFFHIITSYGIDMEIEGKKLTYVYHTHVRINFNPINSINLITLKDIKPSTTYFRHFYSKVRPNIAYIRSAFSIDIEDLVRDSTSRF